MIPFFNENVNPNRWLHLIVKPSISTSTEIRSIARKLWHRIELSGSCLNYLLQVNAIAWISETPIVWCTCSLYSFVGWYVCCLFTLVIRLIWYRYLFIYQTLLSIWALYFPTPENGKWSKKFMFGLGWTFKIHFEITIKHWTINIASFINFYIYYDFIGINLFYSKKERNSTQLIDKYYRIYFALQSVNSEIFPKWLITRTTVAAKDLINSFTTKTIE